ncbi:MAG: sigma-70 family RNA polymerase sigma factor [Spirochaetales bacterium]|nr:sigma-70 family RNA polymerase sigma factor [Spirochaetales bacterium]
MKFSGDFIKRLKTKDNEAFRELYSLTAQILMGYILLRVGNVTETAEDILSEVYCDAITYAGSLTLTHNIKAWLLRIAKSKIGDYYRRLKKEKKIIKVQTVRVRQHELLNAFSNSPESDVLVKENGLLLKAAFGRLPSENREVMRKKYVEGKSMAEIASLINKTEKAVENILYRSRKMFQAEIKRMAKEKIYFS